MCGFLDASIGGTPTKAVAQALGISIRTAHIHSSNAMQKLGVDSVVGMVEVWLQLGSLR